MIPVFAVRRGSRPSAVRRAGGVGDCRSGPARAGSGACRRRWRTRGGPGRLSGLRVSWRPRSGLFRVGLPVRHRGLGGVRLVRSGADRGSPGTAGRAGISATMPGRARTRPTAHSSWTGARGPRPDLDLEQPRFGDAAGAHLRAGACADWRARRDRNGLCNDATIVASAGRQRVRQVTPAIGQRSGIDVSAPDHAVRDRRPTGCPRRLCRMARGTLASVRAVFPRQPRPLGPGVGPFPARTRSRGSERHPPWLAGGGDVASTTMSPGQTRAVSATGQPGGAERRARRRRPSAARPHENPPGRRGVTARSPGVAVPDIR